jgi:hypothetical protein
LRLVVIACATLLAGCQTYKAPSTGPTANISFVFFEGSSLINGSVTASFYPGGKRPLLSAGSIIATVQAVRPDTIEQALKTSNTIAASGEEFVFAFLYNAFGGMVVSSCKVELRFRPEPGKQYVGVFKTTYQRCGGGVMRRTATGFEEEPSAKSAFADGSAPPSEPTEPNASEHTKKPNPWW